MRRSTSHSSSISGNIPIASPSPSDADHVLPTPTPASGETRHGSPPSRTPTPCVRSDPPNPDHRRCLPSPLPPAKCSLLCVFYAEFDIVVGPKVCFQSPRKFMHLDVDTADEDIHQALEETFRAVAVAPTPTAVKHQPAAATAGGNGNPTPTNKQLYGREDSFDYWNWTPESKKTTVEHDNKNTPTWASGIESNALDELTNFAVSRNTSFSSSRGTTQQGDTSTIDTELPQNSIFAATSEYIVTGNELASQTITVSTHNLHVLSRPMIICDTHRYERNSLLFSVGFVLRRNVDPRPYWPCLSKLSSTFRSMEMESEFLSHRRTRPQIQTVLEDVLVSINSKQRDCHLVLDDANMLNLKLFRPPPLPTPPVPDYAVPVLLRPEWQLQMYDWDLTINWIVPHIDGCRYLKQIAVSSEVDMEMVRACLRVLRHHGVLAYIDVFRYSNVYECTPFAMELLNGTRGKKAEELEDAAFWYSAKAKYARAADNERNSQRNSPSFSPAGAVVRTLHPHASSLHSLDLSIQGSNTPWLASISAEKARNQSKSEELSRSFPSKTGRITIKEEHSVDEDESQRTGSKIARNEPDDSSHLEQMKSMKRALSQIYSSCDRNQSFGEMFLAKVKEKLNPTPLVDRAQENIVGSNGLSTKNLDQQQAKNGERVGHDTGVDWAVAFDYFDHRRLITFGLVHGLIRRVHQYPLAHEVSINAEVSFAGNHVLNGASNDKVEDSKNMELSPKDLSPIDSQLALSWSETHPASSFPQPGYLSSCRDTMDDLLLDKLSREEMHARSRKLLLEQIASAMDGTRCDDELSCMFEIPIEKLIEMLKGTGRWKIVSVFSCAS